MYILSTYRNQSAYVLMPRWCLVATTGLSFYYIIQQSSAIKIQT